MRRTIRLNDLKSPQDIRALERLLEEMYEQLDVLYTETAPNTNITARRGKLALYYTGAAYQVWVNLDGNVLWQQV